MLVLGGKSKIPSKFCPAHCEESTSLVPSLMDHQYVQRKHAEEAPLPDNDDDDTVLVGCKKAGNINRFMTELPDFSLL